MDQTVEYIIGFTFATLICIGLIGFALSRIYKNSKLSPLRRTKITPPSLKNHTVISYSIVLPLSALSIFLMLFSAVQLVVVESSQGNELYLAQTILVPVFCYIVGFFYLKRAAGK